VVFLGRILGQRIVVGDAGAVGEQLFNRDSVAVEVTGNIAAERIGVLEVPLPFEHDDSRSCEGLAQRREMERNREAAVGSSGLLSATCRLSDRTRDLVLCGVRGGKRPEPGRAEDQRGQPGGGGLHSSVATPAVRPAAIRTRALVPRSDRAQVFPAAGVCWADWSGAQGRFWLSAEWRWSIRASICSAAPGE